MLSLLVEGFTAAWLPCSLILAVPGAATVLASREHLAPGATGFGLGVVLLSWLRFADLGGNFPAAAVAIALALAVTMLMVPMGVPEAVSVAVGGFVAGGVAAELWEPCVGAEFGALLVTLPGDGPGGITPLAVYLVGVLTPVAGVIALLKLLPPWVNERGAGVLSVIGGGVLGVIAVATAVGLHDEVVAKLFEWSLTT